MSTPGQYPPGTPPGGVPTSGPVGTYPQVSPALAAYPSGPSAAAPYPSVQYNGAASSSATGSQPQPANGASGLDTQSRGSHGPAYPYNAPGMYGQPPPQPYSQQPAPYGQQPYGQQPYGAAPYTVPHPGYGAPPQPGYGAFPQPYYSPAGAIQPQGAYNGTAPVPGGAPGTGGYPGVCPPNPGQYPGQQPSLAAPSAQIPAVAPPPAPYAQPFGQPPPVGAYAPSGPPQAYQTGRKRALLCACNYKGTASALNGCINDAHCLKYLLKTKFGFREEDIVMLTDDLRDPNMWPTRQGMFLRFAWLVGESRPGDSLFFSFSGHGSQTADYTGDEADGRSETLCPCDFKQAGQISDDELSRYLVNPLQPGVRLHAVIDACHSGSMLDLEYRAKVKGGVPTWKNEYRRRPSVYKGTMGGEAIQFGASRDSQTAADTAALSGGVATGAATFSFIQAIERGGPHISYGQVLVGMHQTLKAMNGGGGGMSSSTSSAFGMGGMLGSLNSLFANATESLGASGQTPCMCANTPFDLNRPLQL
ncbi:hypothetical protein WJX72_006942 [[Myrmecia] bisecta]|uniref:Peptidase C14 caspase domain-containing protein n=1 Tax=[Myrmecia] bisecta TaxID=41462 RepID=A0AAW1P3U3_9CHLO